MHTFKIILILSGECGNDGIFLNFGELDSLIEEIIAGVVIWCCDGEVVIIFEFSGDCVVIIGEFGAHWVIIKEL